ncbi:MAG: discoidin domain-containing protein, partial [Nocardioidaceae bacterium]
EQLYAQHFGSLLVAAQSDASELSTYASLSRDHQTLYVVLVNKSPDRPVDATFDVHGFHPGNHAAAWVLDGPTTTKHLENYGLRRVLLHGSHLTVPAYSAVAVEMPARGGVGAAPNPAEDKYAAASSSAFATDPVAGQRAYQFLPASAVDGLTATRWAADYFEKKPAWFQVDLGQPQPFDRVRLRWDYPATAYQVQVSDDGTTWRTVADQSDATTLKAAPQPIQEVQFSKVTGRYVRISMTSRPSTEGAAAGASQWTPEAFSLWELGVYLGQ